MRILIDMDSTLNDFTQGYVNYYNKLTGKNINVTKDDLNVYEISKVVHGHNEGESNKIRQEIFSSPGFWRDIPILPFAYDVVQYLYKEHDVFILTAPWKHSLNCYTEKIEWVEKELPFFDTSRVIMARHKYLVKGDIIVEDSPEFLLNNGCHYAIAIDYPFNRHLPVLHAYDWRDAKTHIDTIQSLKDEYGRLHKLRD